jgi:hypothetical protein
MVAFPSAKVSSPKYAPKFVQEEQEKYADQLQENRGGGRTGSTIEIEAKAGLDQQ